MSKTYLFRRCDTAVIVQVPFLKMMEQDAAGFIVLDDGVEARRCHDLEQERDGGFEPADRNKMTGTAPRHLSDALGFPEQYLQEYEQDRHAHGFSGVEFIRDKTCPQFIQVRCSTQDEEQRYIRHRGMVNKGGLGGVRLSKGDLEAAERMARQRYGEPA